VGNIVHKFFDTDFCALMIFLPDDYIRCVVQQNKINSIFWNVVLTVALPLIMSVYTGIAEKAYETALQSVRRKNKDEALLKTSSGELFNHIELCRILQQDMVRLTNNFDFTPENELGNAMLVRKTLLASACKKTVEKAMELMGGQSYFRNRGIEKLFRDVQACHFHPLPDKQQYLFTGDFILNQKKHRKRLT
jgi:alkylation response protein AidB-like acyl-CoA dehydrogenase